MTTNGRLRSWLREPLLHFLLAGLAVFLFSAWRGEEVDPESRRITIDEAQVSRLVLAWQQTWQRPPTQAEIDGLIRDHIREEIYYREAKRLGLDENDTVIRRRLRAKMEYLATAEIENATPSDAVLQAWFDRHKVRYAADARYSFDQLYLADQGRAATLLAQLGKGEAWQGKGDPISLPASVDGAKRSEVERTFGEEFVAGLGKLPTGEWSGPVRSGFGAHLVRIRSAEAAAPPQLADVRQQVENDWRAATMEARKAKAYQALLDGYTIRIAKP
jgi:peptidyl-prolyl cis-trans isomerase C